MSSRPVALRWYERASTVAYRHYQAAQRFSRLNFFFGLPTVILATVVGTSVFATLQAKPEFWWQVTIGLMSIAAAILSALQSFLGYSDKAEKHRAAGSKYNAVGRELELWLAQPAEDLVRLESMRQRIDALAQESPHIPASTYRNLPDPEKNLLWRQ